jgi:hypothetical protein
MTNTTCLHCRIILNLRLSVYSVMAKMFWAVPGLNQGSHSYAALGDAAGFRFLWYMCYSVDIVDICMIKSNCLFWVWHNLMLGLLCWNVILKIYNSNWLWELCGLFDTNLSLYVDFSRCAHLPLKSVLFSSE